MNAYQDVLGLTRLQDFLWEPYPPPAATQRDPQDPGGSGLRRPKHPTIVKREVARQRTLAKKKGLPPPQPLPQPQTLLGLARGVTSWTECPVPLTVVINREIDPEGKVDDWVLATTSSSFSAEQIRSNYTLRTAIEERHRQYKCFWDLAHTERGTRVPRACRMPSRKFSLVVNQVLFVLLAYTLLQGHLFLRKRKEMNPRTRGRLLQLLNPTLEVVAVYYQQRFCLLSIPEFAVILLELAEEARAKLRPKMQQIQGAVYHLLQNARPP